MKTFSFDTYKLILEDPVLVISGGTYEKLSWGPYQFPGLQMTRNGHILATCSTPVAVDDIDGYEAGKKELPFGRVSEDSGTTWRDIQETDIPKGIVTANGREYFPPAAKNAFSAAWLEKYTPDFSFEGLYGRRIDYYCAEAIPEYPKTPEAQEYDSVTGRTERFRMEVEWPNLAMPVIHHPKGQLIGSMETLMGLMGYTMADPDGTLFFCTYMNGFSAETGKPNRMYSVTVLRSDDGGRHWQYQSEIIHPQELEASNSKEWTDGDCEGFCEPSMTRMPDGSVIMLMRTGSGQPSYITRSFDNCRSWSVPEIFDKIGVRPQLLTLSCGVTLASYGRPGVFLRSTRDKHGLVWDTPIDLISHNDVLSGADTHCSCCYTSLLPLDDVTALVAYSHFYWPNAEGVLVKSILVRKIRIELYNM